jgi:hypothetical protein
MKRSVLAVLAAITVARVLAACGDGNDGNAPRTHAFGEPAAGEPKAEADGEGLPAPTPEIESPLPGGGSEGRCIRTGADSALPFGPAIPDRYSAIGNASVRVSGEGGSRA